VGTAHVPNPPGLAKVGGSLYRETGVVVGGSGTPVFGSPNGSTEQIISSNLELSNVDLASEFVKMIQTQRAYSANSKTITTADEMTQEVLNLKR
jgi:flagellar hook protein FlgE